MKGSNLLKTIEGELIWVTQGFVEHMAAHPDIKFEHLKYFFSNVSKREFKSDQNGIIFLCKETPYQGRSALVFHPVDSIKDKSLFAFRKGRSVPSRVSSLPGSETNLVTVILKEVVENDEIEYQIITAYWSSEVNVGPEPISPSIDTKTEDGAKFREYALDVWMKYALSIREIEIDGECFFSTWEKILEEYGMFYIDSEV